MIFGKFAEAKRKKEMNIGISENLESAIALKKSGDAKRLLGDIQGALSDFNRSLEIESGDLFALSGRGATKLLLQDYSSALIDLR